ncbi:DNA primase [Caulobacter phage Lullwater]|uniref:DNA primase n=1 Tax=Caulobacter phage Lullwater TaxID=2024607 RepID=A0A291LB19_9CAUD|nr:DNA primase [Caulobacter phage Lullwater]ATI16323.1 DNA primase [Caulobacter phage Lullwater]
MLNPRSWLHLAQELEEGQSRLVEHDCGSGRVLHIDHKVNGWGAYCHRCGEPGWVPRPTESLTQRLERLRSMRATEEMAAKSINLPSPRVTDPRLWPMDARVWLYKVGMANDVIEELGFYYHEPTRRVVMPVYEDGKLIYWQARGFDKSLPKYINPKVDRTKLVWSRGDGGVIVLCEDILSAWRVSRVTTAWSTLGTKLSDHTATRLAVIGKPVRVWLDPDKAGRDGSIEMVRKLRSLNVKVRAIRSEKDPKLYTTQEIYNQLGLNPPPTT